MSYPLNGVSRGPGQSLAEFEAMVERLERYWAARDGITERLSPQAVARYVVRYLIANCPDQTLSISRALLEAMVQDPLGWIADDKERAK